MEKKNPARSDVIEIINRKIGWKKKISSSFNNFIAEIICLGCLILPGDTKRLRTQSNFRGTQALRLQRGFYSAIHDNQAKARH